eukprot:TRINITY_DN592_c0_g1_i2.p1 TRINITY_DN592_c0_g1~~TRINITY_DN592_c0_g1_i2.p1  ORF type:complete len:456 (+),score=69.12 TRINITY_DN592_c0_g1_i2:109-1476(+)
MASGKSTPNMQEELRVIWSKDITDLPVFKDLPRLARRIVVLGTLKKDFPLNYNDTEPPEEDKKGETFQIYLNTEKIKLNRASQWPKSYILCTLMLFKSLSGKTVIRVFKQTENQLSLYFQAPIDRLTAVADSTRYFIVENINVEMVTEKTNAGIAFITREESDRFKTFANDFTGQKLKNLENPDVQRRLEREKLRSMTVVNQQNEVQEINELQNFTAELLKTLGSAKHNIKELEHLRDTVSCRLSFLGRDIQKAAYDYPLESPVGLKKESINKADMLAIQQVITSVTAQLETKEKQQKIKEEIDRMIALNYEGDMQLLVENLFRNHIGLDSKTAKVFKAIHQNIIFSCAYQIKVNVTKNMIMTGDVRGPEGWQICVIFANDVVSITHRRREKSIGQNENDKFWFEWVLHMTFDKEMDNLNAAVLKIVGLQFEGVPEQSTREQIEKMFCFGDLLVA